MDHNPPHETRSRSRYLRGLGVVVVLLALVGLAYTMGRENAKQQPGVPVPEDLKPTSAGGRTLNVNALVLPSKPTRTWTCSYNAYNCDDFATHRQAQRVYENCGGLGNDVHRLDRDQDGSACETLP